MPGLLSEHQENEGGWKEWERHGGGSTNHQGAWGHRRCGFHFKWKILIKEELCSHFNGAFG